MKRYPLICLFLTVTALLVALSHPTQSRTTPFEDPAPVSFGTVSIPEGWYRGNTHTHSSMSDGDSPPEEVAARYRDLGYDFLVLSDHNVKVDFSQYSEPGFLCIDGEELTHWTNHTNGLGLTGTLPPGTIQANVDSVLAQGGVPHLNHPSYSGLGASDALSVHNLDLVEIFNYRAGDNDEHIWDGILTGGKRIYGVATDDCHLLYSESGKGWIMVRADSLVQEEILGAIAAGDFYASTGVILNDYGHDSMGMMIDSQNGDRIDFVGRNGRVLHTVTGSQGEYLFDGTETYVRARIRNLSGEYAWTQPVFRTAFDIEPFADEVIDAQGIVAGTPEKSLGPPYEGKVPSEWEEHAVGIDSGGFVVLDMGEGEDIVDREGPDLYVEEVGPEDGFGMDDPYHVYVSDDTTVWFYLGEGLGDAWFDIDGQIKEARYVKIEVTELNAEIDGVEANFIDPWADWVIDYSGLIEGHPRYALGPPSPGPVGDPPENYAVRIDVGGYLELDLGPDEEAVNRSGPDLYIEEVDSEDNPNYTGDLFILYGSMDGIQWTEIGQGQGDTSFDLSGKLPKARYLRLEPVDTDIEIDGVWVENMDSYSPVGFTLEPAIGPSLIP